MNYENLLVERRGRIAIVSLNRPERLNALRIDLMRDIELVTEEFREDIETRVVIFTGQGRHFSAGADLRDPKRKAASATSLLNKQRQLRLGPRMIQKLYEMNQITIAAINGGALGGGACIVSALDFRIGAEDCFCAYPEGVFWMNWSLENSSWIGRWKWPASMRPCPR
jgi:enoyl-CoA hydratase/carnithine racemase